MSAAGANPKGTAQRAGAITIFKGKVVPRDMMTPDNQNKNRIVGMSFPRNYGTSGLEPAILNVLPAGGGVRYSPTNEHCDDREVDYYACSVYTYGLPEFTEWAVRHDPEKIVVGGYHPSALPDDFRHLAGKIVIGACDDFYRTIAQPGQIVHGIAGYDKPARYDLNDMSSNQQIIPDKRPSDLCTSVWTSAGCKWRCDFCASHIMHPAFVSRPLDVVEQELACIVPHKPRWLFIRDENFPLQQDWRERLHLVSKVGAQIYFSASADLLRDPGDIAFMAEHGVYMVCLGLDEIKAGYRKNQRLAEVVGLLKAQGIKVYLSFIINPVDVCSRVASDAVYGQYHDAFRALGPDMITGNFLMPLPGTRLWERYANYIRREDYGMYNGKQPFLVRDEAVRQELRFYLYYHQWKYYTSDFYNREVRRFDVADTLHRRFEELGSRYEERFRAELRGDYGPPVFDNRIARPRISSLPPIQRSMVHVDRAVLV